ncbi:MAG TPA: ABC transporter ATP-binding protein [Leptospiraceae bacterium]|nr:ABC transporter ATP-binding protein [Leptospiraceae bacterium]HMY66170.1 ABC transporter ATP-binding protein [Leptospiraceae bacterium]HMZ58861.1 ABC transporter ATP-binding protein [Leptospiraceae bacterium]HNM01947.1 ABC transporter ATP-binding protein [Leptospiraceae bacterium]HNN03707.1 ABC transporter ATP-binding protein [Leptospiraceae bacterium]
MKIFRRLLRYSFHYKGRLITGILLSFLVSIFNGASLTSMVPIFDSMGTSKDYKFRISYTKRDLDLFGKQSANEKLSRIESIELYGAVLKKRINDYFENKTPDEVAVTFVILVFPVYILKLICLTGAIFFINSAGALATRDLRFELFAKSQQLSMDMFVKEKTGILMSRIINDVDALGKVISSDLKDAIIDFFYILTHLVILFLLSWQLFFLTFVVIPLIMGPISGFAEKIRKATKNQQERLSALNGHLQEVIAGIRVIRAFNTEKRESDKFFHINDELSMKTFKGHFYHQVGPSLVELFGAVIAAIFLAFGAYLISTQNFSKGMFLAFFLTLVFIMRPLKQLSVMYNLIQSAVSAGERVFEIIDKEPDLTSRENPEKLGKEVQSIEFRNVTYSYPGSSKNALENISFKVQKGETVAFVGPSGAGKSTLKDMLIRLIDPTSGEILFNGKDIKHCSVQDLRKRSATVSQDVFLFHATVRENISLGNPYFSELEIRKAAEDAYASEFIENMENGYDTMIGENGVLLSGGQRQRLSIARALLLNPEILILDEATSALDTESERQLQNSLEELFHHRTTFIIAHRLSTIQIADRIFYIEEGQIIESGTHLELTALNGKYKKLYDYQFASA